MVNRLSAACGAAVLSVFSLCALAVPTRAATPFTTLDYPGAPGTFLTGIRGNNIVGNYTIGVDTAGMLYLLSTGAYLPFPEADGDANYPGSYSSSPYGPSVGNPNGILRVVGSYKSTASSPYDWGYLYDGAAAPGSQLTTLLYPNSQNTSGEPTLFTIAHSTFGDQVVGNYDTRLITGNAFLYTISTGAYTNINKPGAVSTTAYGVWGDKIAGGFVGAGVGVPQQGFIYDETSSVWKDYNHPGAVSTHFEGITGGGVQGGYNLVADWADTNGTEHASVLHIENFGQVNETDTWYSIDKPDATLTSANSIYGDEAIGIYTDSSGNIHGYLTTIPGIYNPITNDATLNVNTPGIPVLSGAEGDDIVNNGSITTSGTNNSAIQSGTYGVVTNNGAVAVNGAGSAGVELDGNYGTLLNYGSITAAAGADAIRNGTGAVGSAIVNSGTIDGLVNLTAGSGVRFENSGWMGISAAGAGMTHAINGVFAQTGAGTLSLRVSTNANDALQVTGAARLGGTLWADIQTDSSPRRSYTVLTATDGVTGTFDTVTSNLTGFSTSASYDPNDVMLELTAALGANSGLNRNQQNVADAIDNYFNSAGTLPANFLPLFGLSGGSLTNALSQLSGETAADGQQGSFALMGEFLGLMLDPFSGDQRSGGTGGALGFAPEQRATLPPDVALAYAAAFEKAPPKQSPEQRWSVWGQGFGGSANINGDAATGSNDLTARTYGFAAGMGYRVTPDMIVGFALAGAGTNWSVAQNLGSGSSDSFQAGVYGTQYIGSAYLKGAFAFANHWMKTDRYAYAGDHLTASFDAQSYAGRFEAGYRYAMAPAFGVTPYAALQAQSLNMPGYSETDVTGGGFALSYSGETATDTRSELGARFDKATLLNGVPLVLRARAAWAHDWVSNPSVTAAFQALPGSSFIVNGAPLPDNSLLASTGAEMRLSANWLLAANFDGEFASGAQSYGGTGTLRYDW